MRTCQTAWVCHAAYVVPLSLDSIQKKQIVSGMRQHILEFLYALKTNVAHEMQAALVLVSRTSRWYNRRQGKKKKANGTPEVFVAYVKVVAPFYV